MRLQTASQADTPDQQKTSVEKNLLAHYVEEARNQYLTYLRDKIDQLKENIELNSQTIEYLSLLINKTIAEITDSGNNPLEFAGVSNEKFAQTS